MDNKNDITMIRMSYNNNTIVTQLNTNDSKITFVLFFHCVNNIKSIGVL